MDPDPAFYLNSDPHPDPGSQTNAGPDPDPGQTFKSQKIEFLHEKHSVLKVGIKGQKIPTYRGTKALMKGRKRGLFVSFGQFPCLDPDPDTHSQYGSGSTTLH